MPFFNQSISAQFSRRGLTLVEMLVGMAITLVMMAAVVNLFANISEGVRNRRATMEVSAALRIVRSQLFNDLAGATCLKYPKNTHAVMPKPDSNNPPDGYFEIVEGEYSDDNPGGFGIDTATSLVPSSNRPFDEAGEPLDPNIVTDGGARGDYDDILAMTVESETDRFRGKGRGLRPGGDPTRIGTAPNYEDGDWVDLAISSPIAEVIWYAVEVPPRTSSEYRPEMGEPGMRRIYRRTLLVVPWYGTETKSTSAGNMVTGSDPRLDLVGQGITDFAVQLSKLRDFQEEYDISARLENGRIVPNTLADLARRENRFAHAPNSLNTATPVYTYPHLFPYNITDPNLRAEPDEDLSSLKALEGSRENQDLILGDVLAFDVQVFDPGAPLYSYQGAIIQPGSNSAFRQAVASGPANITGFGSYADLGWNNGIPSGSPPVYTPDYIYNHPTILALFPNPPVPLFQQERRVGWHPTFPNLLRGTPAVYDTWSTYYESDQINQEGVPYNSVITWNPAQIGLTDQGTNGIDDIVTQDEITLGRALNGPDDPMERETSPPYPHPLYGVQVKIRIYEPESRQIRETTVTRNLAK